MAADFSDSDVVADTVEAEETQESEADVEVDTEDPADVEDVDVTEDNASDAEEPAKKQNRTKKHCLLQRLLMRSFLIR